MKERYLLFRLLRLLVLLMRLYLMHLLKCLILLLVMHFFIHFFRRNIRIIIIIIINLLGYLCMVIITPTLHANYFIFFINLSTFISSFYLLVISRFSRCISNSNNLRLMSLMYLFDCFVIIIITINIALTIVFISFI